MEDLSASTIDTRVVYGFKGAGKTSYISDCINNDFFYKYGTTLILCFEQGEEKYDEEALIARKTHVACYDGNEEISEFCLARIREYDPGRIYVEMSAKIPDAREHFPEIMNVTYTVTWFDWSMLDLYMIGMKQEISRMVSESQQVTFRGCPSKELLAPYSQEFRLMNHRATYLRQDPLGFHEKAFDLFVPYSLEDEKITISDKEYLIFWLDAMDHPGHYDGKTLCFPDPLELKQDAENGTWSAGRVVMTCCMADLQFMAFRLTGSVTDSLRGGWITLEAVGRLVKDRYGQPDLNLEVKASEPAAVPASEMILQANRS